MGYFFMDSLMIETKDELKLLKLGQIIGEDYKNILLYINNDSKVYKSEDLLICGILTRNASIYRVNNLEQFSKNISSKKYDRGLIIEINDNHIDLKIYESNGRIISLEEQNKIDYLLDINISFSLNNRLGKVQEIIDD